MSKSTIDFVLLVWNRKDHDGKARERTSEGRDATTADVILTPFLISLKRIFALD
jgi:hypothetical protein